MSAAATPTTLPRRRGYAGAIGTQARVSIMPPRRVTRASILHAYDKSNESAITPERKAPGLTNSSIRYFHGYFEEGADVSEALSIHLYIYYVGVR